MVAISDYPAVPPAGKEVGRPLKSVVFLPLHQRAGLDSGLQHTASCLRLVVRPQSQLHFL